MMRYKLSAFVLRRSCKAARYGSIAAATLLGLTESVRNKTEQGALLERCGQWHLRRTHYGSRHADDDEQNPSPAVLNSRGRRWSWDGSRPVGFAFQIELQTGTEVSIGEIFVRFIIGGLFVSAFAVLGDNLKPQSFVGLFGAAPSPLRCHAYSYDSPPGQNFRCLGSSIGLSLQRLYCRLLILLLIVSEAASKFVKLLNSFYKTGDHHNKLVWLNRLRNVHLVAR